MSASMAASPGQAEAASRPGLGPGNPTSSSYAMPAASSAYAVHQPGYATAPPVSGTAGAQVYYHPPVAAGPPAVFGAAPGAAYPPPGEPMRPSSEIPDPASIARQKKMYEESLDAELDQSRKLAEARVKQQKDALRLQADQQLAIYKAQLEQHVKQEELQLEQNLQQHHMAIQQHIMHQKTVLEQQASSLALEYQQRKMREDMAKQQDEMQREMAAMQERMRQEIAEHQQKTVQLQQQHLAQATFAPPPPAAGMPMPGYASPVYTAGTAPGMGLPPPYVASFAAHPPAAAASARYLVPQVASPSGGAGVLHRTVTAMEPTAQGMMPVGAPLPPPTTTTYVLAPASNGGVPPSVAAYSTRYPPPPQGAVYAGGVNPGAMQGPPGGAPGPSGRGSVFDMVDANHDGYISRSEWRQATGQAP